MKLKLHSDFKVFGTKIRILCENSVCRQDLLHCNSYASDFNTILVRVLVSLTATRPRAVWLTMNFSQFSELHKTIKKKMWSLIAWFSGFSFEFESHTLRLMRNK